MIGGELIELLLVFVASEDGTYRLVHAIAALALASGHATPDELVNATLPPERFKFSALNWIGEVANGGALL